MSIRHFLVPAIAIGVAMITYDVTFNKPWHEVQLLSIGAALIIDAVIYSALWFWYKEWNAINSSSYKNEWDGHGTDGRF